MIRVTIINFIICVSASDIRNNRIEKKINETLQTINVSDTAYLLDLKTFVSDNGLRRQDNGTKPNLRLNPKYYLPYESHLKILDLNVMRQQVYSTQERMLALEPILKKYENDPSFRMAFIYNRLRQIIIDMRRAYTIALNWRYKKRVYEQIYWYSHIVRKYFDVLYIVEHVLDLFKDYVQQIST